MSLVAAAAAARQALQTVAHSDKRCFCGTLRSMFARVSVGKAVKGKADLSGC
jgi:hypothetical protein